MTTLILAPIPEVRDWPNYGNAVASVRHLARVAQEWGVNAQGEWANLGAEASTDRHAKDAYRERKAALDKARAVVVKLETDLAALTSAFPGCDK